MRRRDLLTALPAVLAANKVASGKTPQIKITDVESFTVNVPPDGGKADPDVVYRYPVIRVRTDAGITGTSFLPIPPDVLNNWVKPTLIGDDLFAVDRHLRRLQMERGESGVQSWSGVEHAMWDAIGRAADRPVAELFGGHRKKLRVYRTCVFHGKPDQSDVAY